MPGIWELLIIGLIFGGMVLVPLGIIGAAIFIARRGRGDEGGK